MEDATRAATELELLAAPFDAFDVLENVRLSQTLADPESFKETEHEGLAALVEVVAVILACRGHRGGHLDPDAAGRPRPDSVIDGIVRSARACVDAGSMAILLTTASTEGGLGGIQVGAALREVFVRNWSYSHMVDDTLAALFSHPEIETDCRAAAGCTVDEIRAVFDSITGGTERRWQERLSHMRTLATLAKTEVAKGRSDPDYVIEPQVKERGIEAWESFWQDAADTSTFVVSDLVEESGLPEVVVKAVIDLFSFDLKERPVPDAVRELFGGRSLLTSQPILRDPGGSCVVVHSALLTPAIRGRMEQRLKAASGWERYARLRCAHLESASVALIRPHLPGCTAYEGFKYLVPDPAAPTPQVSPREYTKLVEGDGLLVIDDVAIIIEDKAGALSDQARSGEPQRLRLVSRSSSPRQPTKPNAPATASWPTVGSVSVTALGSTSGTCEKCTRSPSASTTSRASPPSRQSSCTLGFCRQAPPTLDGIAPRSADHLRAHRPSSGAAAISAATDGARRDRTVPCRGRTRLLPRVLRLRPVRGPDPERLHAELPQLGEPSTAVRRRYAKQRLRLLTSKTDALDAWYFYRLGVRREPAEKPRLNANADIIRLVDRLASQRAPGWLRIGTTLLDHNGATQATMAHYPARLLQLTKKDGKPHTMAVVGGARADRSFVMVWATAAPGTTTRAAIERLSTYVSTKKHQLQVAIGAGLLCEPGSPAAPSAGVYDNRIPGPDSALDEMATRMGLIPPTRMTSRTPPPLRRRRNRGRTT